MIGGIIGESFFEILYPLKCVCCSGNLFSREIPICRSCYQKLKFSSTRVCEKCGRSLKEYEHLCSDCAQKRIGIEFSRSCVYYDDISSVIVKKFKYANRKDIGLFIASVMNEKLLREAEYSDVDCITYIPFGYFKKHNRFYNHSGVLAENLSQMTGLNIEHNLISQRWFCVPQAILPENLRRKRPPMFGRGKHSIEAKKVLLIDDVVTTGRTLSDAVYALKKHNKIERVVSLTFAC